MIQIDKTTKEILIDLYNKKSIGLEGNITKLIDVEGDPEFKNYLDECKKKDNGIKNSMNGKKITYV